MIVQKKHTCAVRHTTQITDSFISPSHIECLYNFTNLTSYILGFEPGTSRLYADYQASSQSSEPSGISVNTALVVTVISAAQRPSLASRAGWAAESSCSRGSPRALHSIYSCLARKSLDSSNLKPHISKTNTATSISKSIAGSLAQYSFNQLTDMT
jgi:hypothetical protein